MLAESTVQSCIAQFSQLTQLGDYLDYNTEDNVQLGEDVNILLSGEYEIVMNKDVIEMMERDGSVHVNWSFDYCKKWKQEIQFKTSPHIVQQFSIFLFPPLQGGTFVG